MFKKVCHLEADSNCDIQKGLNLRRPLLTFCLKELGQVAMMVRDDRRSIPAAIPYPEGNNPFSAANDPFGSKKIAYLHQVSNREKSNFRLEIKGVPTICTSMGKHLLGISLPTRENPAASDGL